MSSSSNVFAILGLFTQERPVWQPDEINAALGYTRPTGYRYVKELVEAGMLQKVSVGRYALGGRIIELDYQLRQTDPVLLASVPAMMAAGVASPSAQGQAITITATAWISAASSPAPMASQPARVTSATTSTTGTKMADTWSTSRWMGALAACASSS